MMRSGAHMIAGYRMREMRERRENQCTSHSSGPGRNRRNRANADCNFEGCFPDAEDSASRQATMLSILAGLAIITGICLEDCHSVRVAMFLALIVPVGCATIVNFFGRGRAAEICFIIGATSVLVFTAIAWSLFLTNYRIFWFPTQSVALLLVLVYLAICMRHDSKTHISLTFIVAVPTIAAAILHPKFTIDSRIYLVIPTLTLLAYKTAAAACCRSERSTKLVSSSLLLAGVVVFAGASLSAAAVVLYLKEWEVHAGGFILALLGGVTFNAFLVVRRWENPNPEIQEGLKKTRTAIFESIAIILLMCAILGGVLLCLTTQRIPIFPCVIALTSLYFGLVYAHDPIRGKIPLFVYFILMYTFIAGPLYSVIEAHLNNRYYFDPCHWRYGAADHYMGRPVRRNNLPEAIWFATLQSLLIFIYVFMTALLCTDKQAIEAANHSIEREERLRGPSTVTPEITGTYDSLIA